MGCAVAKAVFRPWMGREAVFLFPPLSQGALPRYMREDSINEPGL